GSVTTQDEMRNCALSQIDPNKILFRRFNSLSNRLWNFFSLARAIADHSRGRITDDNQRGERKILATFYDLCDAVDSNYLVFKLVLSSIEFLGYSWHSLTLSINPSSVAPRF